MTTTTCYEPKCDSSAQPKTIQLTERLQKINAYNGELLMGIMSKLDRLHAYPSILKSKQSETKDINQASQLYALELEIDKLDEVGDVLRHINDHLASVI